MTKRSIKNHGPIGSNTGLGISISTSKKQPRKAKNLKSSSAGEDDVNGSKSKKLESKTRVSDIQEFLDNANLANKNFQTEHTNLKIVNSNALNVADTENHSIYYTESLTIPRRPDSHFFGSKDELEQLENNEFLKWKCFISKEFENKNVVLTPYEKNIEVWRQLWRVVERSDIIVQIVDSRNPLLFYNVDLDKYVKETFPNKKCLLLINKCDLLTKEQIEQWRRYSKSKNIAPVFWSALGHCNSINLESKRSFDSNVKDDRFNETDVTQCSLQNLSLIDPSPCLTSAEDLIQVFRSYAQNPSDIIVVGMIGYPNVGKSSTINRILGSKKSSVSSTPGKTKHFQTFNVDSKLILCDCPGLVMPSYVSNAAEMILHGILNIRLGFDRILGILPLNHIRDFFDPIQLVCNKVPRYYLERLYLILLPISSESQSLCIPPLAREFLTVLAFSKGYMASCGVPDCSRAAKQVLNDVIKGTIKCLTAPPGCSQSLYDTWTYPNNCETKQYGQFYLEQLSKRNLIYGISKKNIDTIFFVKNKSDAHILSTTNYKVEKDMTDKKHRNKHKREKLRRIYGYLDV